MSVNALMASPDGDRPRLAKETQDLIDAAIAEVLTGSHWLHPPMLDEFGLAAALRWYVKGFTEHCGIHLDLELPADMPRLPNHIETALFRVVQECLTNLHHHSGSARAWIGIAVTPTRLRLVVEDEGDGIPAQNVPNRINKGVSLGVGIPGMRERLRVLGGGLEIRSSEHGTRVVATLPITSASQS